MRERLWRQEQELIDQKWYLDMNPHLLNKKKAEIEKLKQKLQELDPYRWGGTSTTNHVEQPTNNGGQSGGRYYNKYLKYKTKYVQLKYK